MKRALALARKGKGWTSPNPCVGAVIVRGGRIVGEGYHQKAGEPHAEVVALQQAGKAAKGATLYVSLEPCCHFGKTSPCTDAIAAAGIKRVVAATLDPNPNVNGKGAERLRQSGVHVDVGVLEDEVRTLIEDFAKWVTTGLPFVTLKLAMSLDGKIATRTGESHWITSEASRRIAHRMRHEHDAVMVGVNTVLKDDPQLSIRLPGKWKQPIKIIVDSHARTPLSARLLNASESSCLIAVTSSAPKLRIDALRRRSVEVIEFPDKDGHVDLALLMRELGKQNILSVLIEGGGEVAWSALEAKLVDKVVFFIAPILIGGKEAPTAVGGRGVERLAEALRLKDVKVRRVGTDFMVSGYVQK